MRILALLLLLPLVAAGTSDDPEVTDPQGDHAGSQLGNNHGDILKAWIEPTGFDGYNTFIQLSELDSRPARYEMTWRVTNVYDLLGRESFAGVRAQYEDGNFAFFHLAGPERNNMVANATAEDVDLAGTVLAWDRPLGPTITQGTQFDDWRVSVQNLDPATQTVIGSFDDAVGESPLVFHTYPSYDISNLTQFPSSTPFYTNGQESIWLEKVSGMWHLTANSMPLDLDQDVCDLAWGFSSGDLTTHVSMRVGDGLLAPLGLRVEAESEYPAAVSVVTGSDGIIQLTFPEEAFSGSTTEFGFTNQWSCNQLSASVGQPAAGDEANLLGWFAVGFGALLVLVALLVVLRSKMQ